MSRLVDRDGQTARQWLGQLFVDEHCHECGRGRRGHKAVLFPFGDTWFAFCRKAQRALRAKAEAFGEGGVDNG